MIEDERIGWHHQLNGHEFEQAPGVGDGQGGLACYSLWGRKQSDTTEPLNRTELKYDPKSKRQREKTNNFKHIEKINFFIAKKQKQIFTAICH